MKVAILQSNYIPWKGYFDLIQSVDTFVIYDCVQYTKNDWRNRNQILIGGKPTWLTIPVSVKNLDQKIDETEVSDMRWTKKHWNSIKSSYGRSNGFDRYGAVFENLYAEAQGVKSLSKINKIFIKAICSALRIDTVIRDASEFTLQEGQTERLVSLCESLGATEYVSGPAAKNYLNESCFREADIDVSWFSYEGYPVYEQNSDPFIHSVSIVDLLMSNGKDAAFYMTKPTS